MYRLSYGLICIYVELEHVRPIGWFKGCEGMLEVNQLSLFLTKDLATCSRRGRRLDWRGSGVTATR